MTDNSGSVNVNSSVIAVRGEATVEVEPEIARLSVTISVRDRSRDGVTTKLAAQVEALRATLDGFGGTIERRETSGSNVHPELKPDSDRVSAYVASLTTTVTVADFAALGDLVLALARQEHASVYGPWWELRHDSPAGRQARKAAVDDAVDRAREYAEAVGVRLERLLVLADSGLSAGAPVAEYGMMRAMATRSATEMSFDLEPARQSVTATVEMRFAVSVASFS
ncbi:SIMPL domain-containing protein [Pilimelia columellifera]|uniref:DUF541 domain-containing protein n=1 Tax=Pilimelia columellifera subsp. columellifera TaxID=706583 RepID=A0ABP6AHC3_9ACTN